ncbi:hypothetical protein [Solimonas variicoloris]|uniref:hypothetical protein n=1 Tax=Solimonas variicoloris TaxID=254408 RepID=UPI00035E6794|nr:hypothetical protein [Solimonas variicoloris]
MMKWRKQTVVALWAVSVAMTAGAWTDRRAEGEAAASVPTSVPMDAARAAMRQSPTAIIASSPFHPAVDGAALSLRTSSPAFAARKIERVRGRAAAFHRPGDAPHRALADAAQALRYEHQRVEVSRET